MSDPIALYVRYKNDEDDLIRKKVVEELNKSPSKSLREVVEGWIKENEQLRQKVVDQNEILGKLDLLIDIHNSYIINEEYHAVYPTTLKTADMIRGLEDSRARSIHAKREGGE